MWKMRSVRSAPSPAEEVGQNGYRVDEAFIKYPQYDINDQNGKKQQHSQPSHRRLKFLGRTLEAGTDSRRQGLTGKFVDFRNCRAEGNPGLRLNEIVTAGTAPGD